ncbi:unnamed protein product [Lota lota]
MVPRRGSTLTKDHPACAAFLLDAVGRCAVPSRRGSVWCVGEELCEVCRPVTPSYQVYLDPPVPPQHPEPRALQGGGATPGGVAWLGGGAGSGGGAMTESRLQGWGEVHRAYLGGVANTYLGGVARPYPGDGVHTYRGGLVSPVENLQHLEGVWRVSCSGPPTQHLPSVKSSDGRLLSDCRTDREDAWRAAGRSVSTQTSPVPSARASFFSRAAQKLSLSRRRRRSSDPEAPGPLLYTGGFSGALKLSPPAVPPGLLRAGSKVTDSPGMGKVKVMVRLCSVQGEASDPTSYLKVDVRKKQLTLCEPGGPSQQGGPSQSRDPPPRRASAPVPKMFAFDAVFSPDASQAEVCSGSVSEVIQSVVNGADGCIFCFGHANLGKTYTLIGRDCSTQSLGVAPTAISWLFRVMEERKEKAGGRFSVSVSAVEISGREETLSDLLDHCYSSSSPSSEHLLPQEVQRRPGVLLQEDPLCGSKLQNQRELRASTADHAAFFLDAALAARTSSRGRCDEATRRNSHFLFTLHVHQQRPEKSAKAAVTAGRSRLHLLDLGSCESCVGGAGGGAGAGGGGGAGAQCLSLSALGSVILALVNGAKHVPYRDSKLTMLLRESLGNINCRTTMIAHVSILRRHRLETLGALQLASRVHRVRKKQSRYASSSSGGESSCEEERPHRGGGSPLRPPHPRTVALDPDGPARPPSDPDYSSSSEQSCDTVIYVGPGGGAVSDRELSDNEGPPAFIPIVPSLVKRRAAPHEGGGGGRAGGREGAREGGRLRCNTFAELQERLDCIDGAEGPDAVGAEGPVADGAEGPAAAAKPPDAASPPTSDRPRGPNVPADICSRTNNPDPPDPPDPPASGRSARGDREKASARPSQSAGKTGATLPEAADPPPSASPPPPRGLQATPRPPGSGGGRAPPVGVSQQASLRGQADDPSVARGGAWVDGNGSIEVHPRSAALLGRCLDRDLLRTTVTLQQPVELNGEDELVFTVVEDLPLRLAPEAAHPSAVLGFTRDGSGPGPVSIISSISDEYDAYLTRLGGAAGVGSASATASQREALSQQPATGLWRREHVHSPGVRAPPWAPRVAPESLPVWSAPHPFGREPCPRLGAQSSLQWDQGPGGPATAWTSAEPSEASLKGSRSRAASLSTSASQSLLRRPHATLPGKAKPTSAASQGDGRGRDLWLTSGEAERRRSGPSGAGWSGPGGDGNSAPRPPKAHGSSSSSQRGGDGCEKSGGHRGDAAVRAPRLTRGATTLGMVSHGSSESIWEHEASPGPGSRFSSLGKRSNGHRTGRVLQSGSGSLLPAGSWDHKARGASPWRCTSPRALLPEEGFHTRLRADSLNHKSSASKTDHSSLRMTSSLKTRGAKGEALLHHGTSPERSEGLTSNASRAGPSRETSGANLGGRPNSSVTRLGAPASTSAASPPPPAAAPRPAQGGTSAASRTTTSGGSKCRSPSSSGSRSLGSATTPPQSADPPPPGRAPAPRGAEAGAKQGAAGRAANSRVSELAAGSPRKQPSGGSEAAGSEGVAGIPSPYSKVTAPRPAQRRSSGVASDNSSVLSGELPPAMGRTALFYHSGGSSGYESMRRDSETASSARDSMSDDVSRNRGRVAKAPKKRGSGVQRRRLIPAPLPDSSLGRRVEAHRPFEITVYQIDHMDPLQRSRQEVRPHTSQTFQDVEKGLQYFNTRLRLVERRQQQIQALRSRRERLRAELTEAKTLLMMAPGRWSPDYDAEQHLDQESQEYLELLVRTTAELEDVVNVCKSHLMMETCFDVTTATGSATRRGL